MFKSPFSFNGRIRRTEYGLSILIYSVIIVIMQVMLISSMSDASGSTAGPGMLFFIVWIPCIYFALAQGAKRCHDLGRSGWFQLIPFYGLWMLFADSKPGINEYGPNPKGIGNDPEFAFEQEQQQN
jgi:uncharacterized membrane protein YhaH (DUF805 family)